MSEEPEAPAVIGQGSEPPLPYPVGDPRRDPDDPDRPGDDVAARVIPTISRVRSEDIVEGGQPSTDPSPGPT